MIHEIRCTFRKELIDIVYFKEKFMTDPQKNCLDEYDKTNSGTEGPQGLRSPAFIAASDHYLTHSTKC